MENTEKEEHKKGIMENMRSTQWNIMFMKRTNRLAIVMFVGGVLYKVIEKLFFST